MMILLLLLSFVLSNCQEFRLPTTILPTNYKLTLQPDIPNNNFNGIEVITIDITDDYFNDTVGNFDVSFNYYPGMNISTAILYVAGTNVAENYTLSEPLDLDATTQIATATFDVLKSYIETLASVDTNIFTLYMEYTGLIRGGQDLSGWYRSEYTYNDNNIINLVTQFQATDARSAFPCFDEPAFKATFDITFIAAADAIKLSNMPQIGDPVSVAGDCTWTNTLGELKTQCVQVTFDTTPEMSTYLLAFVIGGYNVVTNAESEPPQTVYYPYTFEPSRAEFALQQSIDVLDLFGGSDGFDIPYSISTIPKLDSIAVSDFAAGAMENWGLIVYRTVRLLVDDDISSQASKSGQILIIAHELAHQWFGNLVSPAWWDDLWLNEGFATYMAFYGGNRIQESYNLNENKIQAITNVMEDDASVFTHPVQQSVDGDPTQILSSFSSITYQKGMGVINTIANVMGNEDFLSGISTYLDDYKFDVATSGDLGDVLDTVESGISSLMNNWITQEGFPLITVDTQIDGDEITFNVNQKRFVKQGLRFYDDPDSLPFVTDEMVDSFSSQLWNVPMLWRDANGEPIEIEDSDKYILTDSELQFTIDRESYGDIEYYLANPVDGAGISADGLFNFYRVKYDDFSFQLLVDNWLYIGTENQFVIISDRFALMQSSYDVSVESYLDFIRDISDQMLSKLVKGEDIPDYPMFNAIINSLIYIDDVFCELVFEGTTYSTDDKALRGYFRELSRDIVRRILNLVVDNIDAPYRDDHNQCPDDSDCNILQSACLNALVRFNDRQIITRAYEWYFFCSNRICTNQQLCLGCTLPIIENGRLAIVTEDVLQSFISAVLSFNVRNSATLDEIINLYSLVNIEQQTYILNGLWAVYEDPNNILFTKALDFIMSETVRTNMKVNALVSMKQCTGRNKLWDYVSTGEVGETVFDQLFTDSGLFSQEPLTALANTFASVEKEEEVGAFFSQGNRVNAGTERIVNQTLENIYSRGLWKEDNEETLQIYLRTYIVDKLESSMEIYEIILIILGCCLALICLVVAFWAVSKPTESDRTKFYLSKKRERRERSRTGSLSHRGAGQALTSSLGQSLDRTLKNKTSDDTKAQDKDELAVTHGNKDIIEEPQEPQNGQQGYGSTDVSNYSKLKDDQQT